MCRSSTPASSMVGKSASDRTTTAVAAPAPIRSGRSAVRSRSTRIGLPGSRLVRVVLCVTVIRSCDADSSSMRERLSTVGELCQRRHVGKPCLSDEHGWHACSSSADMSIGPRLRRRDIFFERNDGGISSAVQRKTFSVSFATKKKRRIIPS